MSEQPHDDLLGKTLGQYTILEEIGRGGMATVYKARQQSVNRIVAVKVLPRHFLHDPGFLERFNREVDVAAHLEHPHILPIYDYGEANGAPYIAMRYLGGGSMAELIRRGVPPLETIEKPFTQIAQALDYAHQQGIIHRDLKPGNIMLDESGNAYLSDFGIVHVLGSNLTGSMIVGTPAYMSPEQANGLPIDSRSDIYALGVVLFELLTGREPYQAETPMALLLKHINEPMPPVRDFREGVPAHVEDVIAKATSKDPDDRYSAALDMARAFTKALRGEKLETRERPAASPPPMPSMAAPSAPKSAVPSTSPGLREDMPTTLGMDPTGTGQIAPVGGSRMGLWIGLLVVAALIVGAVLILPGIISPPPPPVQPALDVNAPATPPSAVIESVITDVYSISIPRAWQPELATYIDISDEVRVAHLWQAADNGVFITISVVSDDISIDDYHARYYQPQLDRAHLAFISEETAPDETVRRSYRLLTEANGFGPGQMDVYYIHRNGRMGVLEQYTADRVGTDRLILNNFQIVLDSVRLRPPNDSGG